MWNICRSRSGIGREEAKLYPKRAEKEGHREREREREARERERERERE